ncbi:glutamine synthetase family protein [Thermomicrobium sp. 4228-Ro]|uniref:glutamine synthetase family protein n=1 Tax=Thermomicrobium sp. 4228-Ro TaxID=2993937 RepID=UPI002248FDF5|nr:glutamine synthetase family protein [Thermomicrobium sp. 4228-Ro]MCX2727820.1 glutamine synthetase family protein [Thermomicrobium sp. 4228-Ro]
MDIATVTRLLRAAGIRWVRIEMADTHGIARSKSVPIEKFPTYAARGVNFYGGMLLQDASGWDIPLEERLPPPDYLLKPDLDTLTVLPYAPGEVRVLGDLYRDGSPAPEDPRVVCRRMVERFRARGWIPRSAFEYEFYLLHATTREPVFRDKQICSTLRNNFDPAWRDELLTALEAHGIAVSTLSVENAPGQFEITFDPADGLAAADQAFMFRTVVKEVSRKHGYIATFMTKPFIDQAASGTHLHHSLIDATTGQNVFADPQGMHGLSELAWYFLGGLFEHARALIAVFSPTPNDYKRYQPGLFAPTSVCWGYDNRSAAFRVPADAHGKKARIENRLGGAAANPYIALAASLAAGWDGIERRLEPPEAIQKDVGWLEGLPPLPRSLDEALDALERDTILCDLLGRPFIETYVAVKRWDAEKCRRRCPDYRSPEWNHRIDPYEWEEYGELI